MKQKKKILKKIIKYGYIDQIQALLNGGTNIYEFLCLCTKDDTKASEFLNEYKNSAEPGTEVYNRHEHLINLIEHNADVNEIRNFIQKYDLRDLINFNGGEILLCSVGNGDIELVSMLISEGGEISKCETDPIIVALKKGRHHLLEFLIKKGSNIKNIMPEHLELCLTNDYDACFNFILNLIDHRKLQHFCKMDLTKCFEIAITSSNFNAIRSLHKVSSSTNVNKIRSKYENKYSNRWIKYYFDKKM